MRLRSLVCLAAAGFFSAACSPAVKTPDAAPADSAAAVSPSAAVGTNASAAAPSASATSAAASAPEAEPPPAPVSPETLAKLPPDAAAYFAVRLGSLARALAARPGTDALLRDFGRELEGLSPEKMVAAGVDPKRAILGAMVAGGSEKSARAVLDAMSAGSAPKGLAKLLQEHAKEATLVRLLVPLASGTTPAAAAATLARAIAHTATLETCPGAAGCKDFGADAPIGVARGAHVIAAAYADGADLRLDVAVPLFAETTSPGALAALLPFGAARGGLGARCSRFDPTATLSLCLDAHGLGDVGAMQGYGMTVMALSGGSVDPSQQRRIAAVGRDESLNNLTLAAPARRLAGDGTVVARLEGAQPSLVWSWALTDPARPAVEKAFAAERCAQGHAVTAELVPALRAAFGDPGPGFTDPKKTMQSVREAGWVAYVVMLAGTWPNLLDTVALATQRGPEVPSGVQVCARAEAGRLALSVR